MNERSDQQLLNQIGRLLDEGKPTGDALLDSLARTVPQARPTFQKQLEDRLTARVQPAREAEEVMIGLNGYTHTKQQSRVPVTLLVAMIVVMLVGSILIFSRRPQLTLLAQLTQTPTLSPTPVPALIPADLRPVVIAIQNLPRGTGLGGDMAFQLATVYWPSDLVPSGTYSQIADLAGLTVMEAIAQWQPILSEKVASADAMPVATLPPDRIAVSIPVTTNVGITYGIQEGDLVDIIATILYVNLQDNSGNEGFGQLITPPPAQTGVPLALQLPDGARLIQQRVIQEALVVNIGEFPDEGEFPLLTLAVSPQDATTLTWLIEAHLPLQLQRVQSPLFAPDDPGSCGSVESQAVSEWVHPLPGSEFTRGFSDVHTGVDFVAPIGTAIHAAADGAVIFAGWNSWGYGNTVVLAHGTRLTVYAHLETIRVHCGEQVKAGATIGTLGSTGNASGPHLHFELRDNNIPQDPATILPDLVITSSS